MSARGEGSGMARNKRNVCIALATGFRIRIGLRRNSGRHPQNFSSDHFENGLNRANTYNKFDPTSPFGGYKESGFGREGGAHGLAAYLQLN
jgi:hypothetical protein